MHPEWDGKAPLPGDRLLVSASSLSSVLSRPALETWTRNEIARKVVAEIDMVAEMAAKAPTAAEKWVSEAHWEGTRGRLSASERGTIIHDVFEAWLHPDRSTPHAPEELWPHLEMLSKAVEALRPRRVASELAVCRPDGTRGWAGRLDGIYELEGFTGGVLLDLKTAGEDTTSKGNPKRPYADAVSLQLGAYMYATHAWPADLLPRTISRWGSRVYLLSDIESAQLEPAPKASTMAVLHVTPGTCSLWTLTPDHDSLRSKVRSAVDLWWYLKGNDIPKMTKVWEA
ncbi:MAG: hypothetical protein D6683_09520 [Actinomyces sp.]|nr:MAG: hypothetical protein D6683_09520 [Actinomyces sp.]